MATTQEPVTKEMAREMLALGHRLVEMASAILGESEVAIAQYERELAVELEREPEPRPDYDVGRFGKVNEAVARVKASMLGEFDRMQFAEALGLKRVKTSKWIRKLLDADLIEFEDGMYRALVAPELRDWVVAADGSFKPEEAAQAVRKSVEEIQDELHSLEVRGIISSVNGNGLYRYVPPPNDAPRSRPRRPPPEKDRPSYELARATGEPVRVRAVDKATRRQRSTSGAGGIHGAKAKDRRFAAAQQAKEERAAAQKAKAQRQPKFKSHSAKRSRPAA